MKNKVTFLIVCLLVAHSGYAKEYKLESPNKKAHVLVNIDKDSGISATVYFLNKEMVFIGPIAMDLTDADGENQFFGEKPRVRRTNYRDVDQVIIPVVKEKRAKIRDHYREMELLFRDHFRLIFRAYDDGVAYRIKTDFEGDVIVNKEKAAFTFPADEKVYYPTDVSFFTHSERLYEYLSLSEIGPDHLSSTPFLVDREDGISVLITEADLEDYPGLYVFGDNDSKLSLNVKLPPYVLKDQLFRDRDVKPVEVADFLAKTDGNRFFPWRVVAFTGEDKEILSHEIVYKLAQPCRIEDPSWIKPGLVSWDWWNATNNRGVSFVSGVNTATYKYHIDFASEYGLDYIILDEGWSVPGDLFQINPEVDVEGICKYAEEKGVGIILWVLWNALEKDMDRALDQFAVWGVKGIKVDFMQRDDQWMVNYYWKVSKAAADRKMLVDFHGSYKPCGLRRAYPNMITREGLKGLENCKWSYDITPDHDCTLPFIRQFAGPMDYTPGAMRNSEKSNFRPAFTRPFSQGTRAHQLALYVVFESPLQMLADAPSNYYREKKSMEFLSNVPVEWDETIPLAGKIGDLVVVARQSGDDWYIGAITDWDAREIEVKLDFLPYGEYTMTEYKDGINADRFAEDLTVKSSTVQSGQTLILKMTTGGGYVAKIRMK